MKNEKLQELQKLETSLSTEIVKLASEKNITFPKGYDPQKALTNAMLYIKQTPDLQTCTQASLGQSLLNMVTLGLDLGKQQCSLQKRSNSVKLFISYFGNQTIIKRINGVLDIRANVIYEGDDFDVEYDQKNNLKVKEHKTSWKNKNNDVAGAYVIIDLDPTVFGRSEHVEVMTINEIKTAWAQGSAKGASPAHKNFPQEMAKKSVINRGCKNFVNTITDNPELIYTYNKVISEEYSSDRKNFLEEKPAEQNLTDDLFSLELEDTVENELNLDLNVDEVKNGND